MPQTIHRRLIDEVCVIEGIPDPSDLYDMAALKIDDVSFVLLPVGQDDDEYMMFVIDYGEPPEERRPLVLQRLLEANALMTDPFLPKFGIDAHSGRIMLSRCLRLEALTAESLIETMKDYAAQAREWKCTHFLLDEERAAARPRLAGQLPRQGA